MPTQKWCSVPGCKEFIFASLDDFDEFDWSAFQIPDGEGEIECYCPKHQKEMQQKMEKMLMGVEPK